MACIDVWLCVRNSNILSAVLNSIVIFVSIFLFFFFISTPFVWIVLIICHSLSWCNSWCMKKNPEKTCVCASILFPSHKWSIPSEEIRNYSHSITLYCSLFYRFWWKKMEMMSMHSSHLRTIPRWPSIIHVSDAEEIIPSIDNAFYTCESVLCLSTHAHIHEYTFPITCFPFQKYIQ